MIDWTCVELERNEELEHFSFFHNVKRNGWINQMDLDLSREDYFKVSIHIVVRCCTHLSRCSNLKREKKKKLHFRSWELCIVNRFFSALYSNELIRWSRIHDVLGHGNLKVSQMSRNSKFTMKITWFAMKVTLECGNEQFWFQSRILFLYLSPELNAR